MHFGIFLIAVAKLVASSPVSQFDDNSQLVDDFLKLNEESKHMQVFQLDEELDAQCMFVKSEEGLYSFKSPGLGNQVCGLYIIAQPDKQVEFEFKSLDISCTKGGLLSVVDGWELNGQFFPSPQDHPLPPESRYAEFCGKTKPRKPFKASQNVGLLQFRIPVNRQGFTVVVKFHSNPKPCNAVLQDPFGTYTLRNHNRRSNCSVSIIYPMKINLLATSVGIRGEWKLPFDIGLVSKCSKRGIDDYVEVRGGDGLDPMLMKRAVDFCGQRTLIYNSEPGMTIGCGNTAVRLVSSGRFMNSVTFSFEVLSENAPWDLTCENFEPLIKK